MTANNKDKNEEWEILGHDPVPGYRAAFYFAVLVSVVYLIIAFSGLFGGHHAAH